MLVSEALSEEVTFQIKPEKLVGVSQLSSVKRDSIPDDQENYMDGRSQRRKFGLYAEGK